MFFGHCLGGWMWIGWPMIIVIGVLAWLSFGNKTKRELRDLGESPEEILKRRYARGEIDQETYKRTLDELRK